jgi:hypothetical protein
MRLLSAVLALTAMVLGTPFTAVMSCHAAAAAKSCCCTPPPDNALCAPDCCATIARDAPPPAPTRLSAPTAAAPHESIARVDLFDSIHVSMIPAPREARVALHERSSPRRPLRI